MRVLALTYPLTGVAATACGGTEQVAFQLLREVGRSGTFHLTWIGAADSHAQAVGVPYLSWERLLAQYGLWRPQPEQYTPDGLDDLERRCNNAVARFAREHRFDLIHNQGAAFHQAAARVGVPVLFTLHLARSLYPESLLQSLPANLHLQCVSHNQAREYGPTACCGVIPNGVDLEHFAARRHAPDGDAPLLYLGRICAEKGAHLAIALARRTRRRLWLVGAVAPFPEHQRYFEQRIAPQLDANIRWMPPPRLPVKRALLAAAAAVVIPSRIAETSSLVAMEAAAAGVPALALRAGALPEIIVQGETGWIADDWEALAEAVPRLAAIAPAACRARAEREFSARRMAEAYLSLYRRLTN